MNQFTGEEHYTQLLNDVTELFAGTRTSLVESYWKTGKYISSVEENLPERAGYGKYLIDKLTQDLTKQDGMGFSNTSLNNMRVFFRD